MSIRREHKSGDLDRRLKILNQQLYGKEEKLDVRSSKLDKAVRSLKLENQISNLQSLYLPSSIKHPTANADILYLKHDLMKIAVLASLAFAAQFALYFGSIHKLIKLPF